MAQIDLRPVRISRDPARRSFQLLAGLALYGASVALVTRARLGLEPWSVLAEGVMKRTGLTFGTVTGVVSVAVLLLWIPLRQRPGIGTIANVVVISVVVDLVRAVLPDQHDLGWQIALLVGGVLLNAVATATYVGARLGPGPRDGLMTGLAGRTGWSVRLVRTGIEITVVGAGFLLGGTVGVGTVLYALAIGPLTQILLPLVVWREPQSEEQETVH
ncbi:YczE/YyaS/YitT family protein [Amycolatopsis sp. cmx-8-4]|uniref:membrane protein YczE n=1 Tax=Amycolatopsis sp. cmx-8-4 TaxID=2790947 RepID=UPI0039799FE7